MHAHVRMQMVYMWTPGQPFRLAFPGTETRPLTEYVGFQPGWPASVLVDPTSSTPQ